MKAALGVGEDRAGLDYSRAARNSVEQGDGTKDDSVF